MTETLAEWADQLETVLSGGSDDCVRMLAGEGKSIRDLRDRANNARTFLTESNLETVRQGRIAVRQLGLALGSAGLQTEATDHVDSLRELLDSPELPQQMDQVRRHADAINEVYGDFYRSLHKERFKLFSESIDTIKGHSEFLQLDEARHELSLLFLDENEFSYQTPTPNALYLEGPYKGGLLRVKLRLVDEHVFLLNSRGFHWISESPFNR